MTKKEKTSWEKLKGESAKAYHRFQTFLQIAPEERTLEKTREILNSHKNSQNSRKNGKVSLAQLQQMSAKWSWMERASLYDHQKILEEIEKNDENFNKNNEKFKKIFETSLKFADDLLKNLMENPNGNALSTRINMFNTLMNVLDTLHRNYRLACGRATIIRDSNNEHHVEAEVETIVGEENLFEYSPEEMKRIQNISNSDDDFLDKL